MAKIRSISFTRLYSLFVLAVSLTIHCQPVLGAVEFLAGYGRKKSAYLETTATKKQYSLTGNTILASVSYESKLLINIGIGLFGRQDRISGEFNEVKFSASNLSGGLLLKTWYELWQGRVFTNVDFIVANSSKIIRKDGEVQVDSLDPKLSGFDIDVGYAIDVSSAYSIVLATSIAREKVTFQSVQTSSPVLGSQYFKLPDRVDATMNGQSYICGMSYKIQ